MPSAPLVAALNIRVKAGAASAYQVQVGSGILATAADGLVGEQQRVLLVFDQNLPLATLQPLLRRLRKMCGASRVATLPFLAREDAKSVPQLVRVLTAAAAQGLTRDDLLVAVGGGITTDTVGLAACMHRRGCRLLLCPTTLLSMVDGAVGGKTGVNLLSGKRLLKNAIGAFYEPSRVVCDVATLASLPLRDFRCGLAECIKHGLIAGRTAKSGLFGGIAAAIDGGMMLGTGSIGPRGEQALCKLVAAHVAFKASVVKLDPRETKPTAKGGGRMALNLGHTFAHAIETMPGLRWTGPDGAQRGLHHGEAVGLGLIASTRLSAALGHCSESLADLTQVLVGLSGLPVEVAGLPQTREVVRCMQQDKKSTSSGMRLVLATDELRALIRSDVPAAQIERVIESIRV